MTVSTTAARAEYTGNGSTVAFAVVDTAGASAVIPVVDSSHLKVYVDGTLKTLDTHYTVSINDTTKAATVTFKTSPTDYTPASSSEILILRIVPYTQLQDYVNNDAFDAENVEAALDQLTQALQQINDDAGSRSIRFSSTLATSEFNTDIDTAATINVSKTNRANKYLSFDGNGDISVLSEITGVTYSESAVAAGHILRYSGSAWVNSNILALDDTKLYFGTNSDISIEYDEAGDDTLLFQSLTGTALNLGLFSDAGEDNADKWKLSVADGGVITWNSKISGSYVPLITFTPHATATQSSVTIAGDLTVNGTTTTIDTANLLVEDPLIVLSKNTSGGSPSNDCGLVIERGDLNNVALIWDESEDEFAFLSNTSETGGTAGNINMGAYGSLRLSAIDVVGTQSTFTKTGADANPLYFDLRKTRNSAHTGGTALSNNDVIGHIRFMGDDGNSWEEFASIKAVVNGAVGNADTPGDLQFHTTPDGSATPAQRMVITKAGNIGIPASPGSSSAGFGGPIVEIEGSGPALMLHDTGTGTPLWELGATGEKFYITDDGSNRLVIDSSGNIGINDSSPSYKLTVDAGTVQDTACKIIQRGGYAGFVVESHPTYTGTAMMRLSSTGGGDATLQFTTDDSNRWNITVDNSESNDPLNFYDYTTATNVMTLVNGIVKTTSSLSAGGGLYISTTGTAASRKLSSASSGATPITLYWGNQTVTTSSDVRLKQNITDTEINGLEKINQLQVKDFTWNDPTDIGINNRNVRGKWTGLIAQEIINVLPFTVNAPRDEETLLPIEDAVTDDGEILPWNVEFSYMVPVLVKAIQELSAKVTALEGA